MMKKQKASLLCLAWSESILTEEGPEEGFKVIRIGDALRLVMAFIDARRERHVFFVPMSKLGLETEFRRLGPGTWRLRNPFRIGKHTFAHVVFHEVPHPAPWKAL